MRLRARRCACRLCIRGIKNVAPGRAGVRLREERAQDAQLVQREQRAAVAALADEELPELKCASRSVAELRADALQLLDEQVRA